MAIREMLEVPTRFGYRPSEGPGQPAQSQLRASRGEVAELLPPGYRARVSGGSRNLPYVPWLAVLDEDVSSPFLLRLFGELNDGKPYGKQIKPFNFMLTTFVPRAERPADDQRMVLVAPFETDAERWLQMPWVNRYSKRQYQLTEEPFQGFVRPGVLRPRTYRDILSDYLANPEPKSLAPDGSLCAPDTAGLLHRRQVRLATLSHIGKESNRLEDVQAGLVEGLEEVINQYDDSYMRVFQPLVVPVLRELGVRETARRTGHSVGAVSAALRNISRPRPGQARRYLDVAAEHARADLGDALAADAKAEEVLRAHAERAR